MDLLKRAQEALYVHEDHLTAHEVDAATAAQRTKDVLSAYAELEEHYEQMRHVLAELLEVLRRSELDRNQLRRQLEEKEGEVDELTSITVNLKRSVDEEQRAAEVMEQELAKCTSDANAAADDLRLVRLSAHMLATFLAGARREAPQHSHAWMERVFDLALQSLHDMVGTTQAAELLEQLSDPPSAEEIIRRYGIGIQEGEDATPAPTT